MKKTIIAILALGGVALAADAPATIDGATLNKDLTYYLNKDAYTGGDFSISFTIQDAKSFAGQKTFITLYTDKSDETGNTGYFISTQVGTYVGLATTKNADCGTAPTTTLVDGVNTITRDMSAEGATLVTGWMSKNSSGTVTDPGLNGSTYTITLSGNDTIIEMSFDPTNTSKKGKEKITLENYKLNLNDFAVLNVAADSTEARLAEITNASVTYNGTTHNLMIPEPATATLSLLALAGLAARRRRH